MPSYLTFRLLRLLVGFSLVLTYALTVRADPLDRRQLPAAATWLVHVDVDAANASTLGQGLRDEWLKQPEVANAIAKARIATGMDPLREIKSLTLFGLGFTPEETVLIVHANVNRPRLELVLKTLPDYRSETIGGHEIYSWTERKPEAGSEKGNVVCPRSGAFYGEDKIVISPATATLFAALDVMDGKAPALGEASPLSVLVSDGTIVQAAVAGLANAKMVPIQSSIFRTCDSGSACLGERQGVAFLRGRVLTRSSERAEQVNALIQGARAMAQLNDRENPIAATLLQPLHAAAEGNAVEAQWEFSSAELVKIIHQAQEARKTAAPSNGKSQ